MKKSLIFKILYLFLVLIVVAGASVFATNTYLASQVSYGNSNVEDALNGLFTLKENTYNYSTDEQIVGTWFDGKKIYRKINTINNTLTANWYSICNIENVDQFISAKLIPKNGQDQNNLFYYNLSYNYPSAGQISVSFIGGNSMVGYAIIEYTKTTDTPSNN